MKKAICVFAMAFATATFTSNNTFAQASPSAPAATTTQDDGKKEKITAEQLPAEVVSAWTQGDNAKAQVSEINKVTKGEEVWYEVSYAGTDGTAQTAKFKADGTKVNEEDMKKEE
jgi:hypothetical protein